LRVRFRAIFTVRFRAIRAPGGEPVAPCKILPKIVFVFGIYDNIIKDYNNKDKI
jgi:hypothetical protein